MTEERGLSLPLAVAELVSRMTPDEQEALAGRLSWEQLRTLEAFKLKQEGRIQERDPHVYVSIGPDSVSFELPQERVAQLIQHIAAQLAVTTISIRLPEDGDARELSRSVDELGALLAEKSELLGDEPVVIEMNGSTLYSQGGGCLLLQTRASVKTKQSIVETFLQLCGYAYPIRSDRFTALVRNGELEIIES